MMSRVSIVAVGLVLGFAGAAAAQEHPLFLPTRDVAVTYQLDSGGQQGATTHLYYTTQGNRLRIDTPNGAGYTVLDKDAGQRLMVNNQMRQYVSEQMDPRMAEGFVLNSTMTYRRGGTSSVAGIPCTEWSVKSDQASGTACVTDDGVLLRGTGKSQQGDTSLVATNVQYGPQPDELFQPTAGFQRMDPSQLQQGSAAGNGGPQGSGGPGGPGGQ